MPDAFGSLRFRIFLMLGLIFVVVLTIAGHRAYERRASDMAQAMERLKLHAQLMTEKQTEAVRQTMQFLDIVADTREVLALSRSNRCPQALARLKANSPYFANLLIASPEGDVVCSAIETPANVNLADRSYFPTALASRNPVIGEAVFGRSTRKWILPFAQAFRDERDTAKGVVGVGFDLGWVNEEFRKSGYPADARLGLIDSRGTVLARYPDPENLIGKNLADVPLFKTLKSQDGNGTAEVTGYDGIPRVYAFSHFAKTVSGPIYLWVGLSKASVTGAAEGQFMSAIAITIMLALVTFSLAWYGGERLLVRPIAALIAATRRLSHGDHQVTSGLAHTKDEIGELARAFDDMTKALASANEVVRLNRALKVIGTCNKALVYAKSEMRLLNEICRMLVDVGGYRCAWVGYCEENADIREVAWFAIGDGPRSTSRVRNGWEQDCTRTAIRTGIPQVNLDVANDPILGPWRDDALKDGYRFCSAFPLKGKSRVFGALTICSADQEALTDDEEHLLRELTENVAFGILALRSDAGRSKAERELANYRDHLEQLVADRTHALAAALESAEAANRAKSVFLSNMSHELRTPLSAVIGFSRLMAKSAHLDESEKRNLEIINRSGNHLLTLINDVLELSKIEAGVVGLSESPTDVAALAREVVDMLRPRAAQGGLKLELAIADVPPALQLDASKLRQIFINLIGNAVKFTREGSVEVAIKGYRPVERMTGIECEIRDTGIGIEPEHQAKIFEPFAQLVTHATTSGTGLGLTITRRYLRMFGSELELESAPGKGSIFRFRLRLQIAEQAAPAPPVEAEVTGLAHAARGKRVLIVEDNPDAVLLLIQLLEPLGFVVETATDGLEAIGAAERFQPDLIIMDWRMPRMDGLEATRRIRALKVGNHAKILMLTASAFEEQRQEALAAGVDGFLRKPMDEACFFSAIEQHLDIEFERRTPAGQTADAPAQAEIVLDADALAALPRERRDALRVAVEELNRIKLNAALADIAVDHAELARAIGAMADVFRYKELWELLGKTTD